MFGGYAIFLSASGASANDRHRPSVIFNGVEDRMQAIRKRHWSMQRLTANRWKIRNARSQLLRDVIQSAAMRFAKIVFRVAAVWGVLVITPLYFMFDLIGRED